MSGRSQYPSTSTWSPVLRWLPLIGLFIATLTWGVQAWADDGDTNPDDPPVTILKEELTRDGLQTTIQIPMQRDTFVSSAHPTTNYGLAAYLHLGYDASNYQTMRMLVKFSLSSVPANAYINSAQLSIYEASATPATDYDMGYLAQYMKANWDEGTVTWNNVNYLGGASLPVGQADRFTGWKIADVTQAVRDWYSGAKSNYGLLITGDEGPQLNRSRMFYSRQQPGLTPYLTVTYSVNCDTWAPVATANALPSFSPGSYVVTWGGDDVAPPSCTPKGIAYYDIQYRINGQAWVAWRSGTQATSGQFNYAGNADYVEFRVRAVDKAGNLQAFAGTQAATRVDTQPPTSYMNALPEFTIATSFLVTWGGNDNLSGVQFYDAQFRIGEGPWEWLLENTTETSFMITGAELGQLYEFRVRAVDNVYNSQEWPETYQIYTRVFDHPITFIEPIQPSVIKPTAPITDSFQLKWTSYTAPDATINHYEIWVRYQENPWALWQNAVPGATSAITFTWLGQTLGGVSLGDGRYEFEILAIPNVGNNEPRDAQAEAAIYVDMADALKVRAYSPIMSYNSY